MRERFLYFIVAAVFMFASVAHADVVADGYSYPVPDEYSQVVSVVAMAGGTVDQDGDGICMASCRTSLDSDVLANWRTDSWAMYANYKITDNRIPRSIIACGTVLELSDIPTKIPIGV